MPILPLTEFRDKHKGQDIYVLASGPSFDYVDHAFLSDKITIGINEIYKKFKPTYLIRKDPGLLKASLTENPTTHHFISRGKFGDQNTENQATVSALPNLSELSITLFDHEPNRRTVTSLPSGDRLVVSYSTITSAIHLAAYMGAKTILLIGHDCGTLDGEVNCGNYYTPESRNILWKQGGAKDYQNWVLGIEDHTIALKSLIKTTYGCSIHSINPFINFNLEGHKYSKAKA
jgi:hypothetical protein